MNIALPFLTKNKLVAGLLILMSMLMAAYGPAHITNAQAAAETQAFKTLKEKALKEVDRRLDNYKKTRDSLEVDVKISKAESSISITSDKGDIAATINEDGADGRLELSDKLKDKVKQFVDKIIEQLEGMKDKVKESVSLDNLKDLAGNLDEQFQLTQLTDVQASVTNAIESLTGIVDKIETSYSDLRGQVKKMKECINGIKEDGELNVNAQNRNVTVNATAAGCEDFNLSSEEVINKAESQMANIETVASTIKSVLASAMALLMSLVTSFTGLLGGLGSLGSLGNLGNLGNIGDLGSLLGSAGNMGGIMSSFSAITSQLGIANGMSGNAFGGLANVGNLINTGGLGSFGSLGDQLLSLGGLGF